MKVSNPEQLNNILSEAVDSYLSRGDLSNEGWLQGYLQAKLPDKSEEEITLISSTIIETIHVQEEKQAEMEQAVENGQTAEQWFVEQTMAESESAGETAKCAAECSAVFDDSLQVDEIPAEEWEDEKWSSFRLKDALKNLAVQAGQSALKAFGSSLLDKVRNKENEQQSLNSKIKDAVILGADTGLKTAVAGALEVAQESGIIQNGTLSAFATIGHRVVEGLSVVAKVAKKEISPLEAAKNLKDKAIAAAKGVWQKTKKIVVRESMNAVFGFPAGQMVYDTATAVIAAKSNLAAEKQMSSAFEKVASVEKTNVQPVKNVFSAIGNKLKNFLFS